MGQKVNYNKNSNNKFKIIGIVVLVLLILIILMFGNKNSSTKNNSSQNTSGQSQNIIAGINYKNLEDLLENYGCELISNSETSELLTINLKFKYELYTGDTSNESYFSRLCNSIAIFKRYKNIKMIDKSKDITIEIFGNGSRVVGITINGDSNYYLNQSSSKNKNLSTKITDFTIESPELQELINSNWDENRVNWGTKESTCNGYNIYFEKGIKYKVVARNVFNVIFTSKYSGNVAGGLTPTSDKETVEANLGKPTFSDDNQNVYGYLSENNYLFFDFENKEISVYPSIKITKDDEKKLEELITEMNNSEDIKKFALNLTTYWTDYDIYDYDSSLVDLRYTLKGFQLYMDGKEAENNGIFIYQNYSGNRDIAELDNVYIKDSDFVFESEIERLEEDYLNRHEQGDLTDEEIAQMGTIFTVRTDYTSDGELSNVKMFCRDLSYPDCELNKSLEISSWKWLDDFNLVYSVNNDGIYIYNCATREVSKLADINEEEITIDDITDGKIIYNQNQEISITN